ncbi:MAG: hypothetical protein L6425_07690, partial [Candidatus Aminicenantes bacterium]|nr:hypothetical protein [Candidatus Aminicenantes bacterium]
VDSTFLLKAWKDSSDIPPLAVFVRSEIIPEREAREAEELRRVERAEEILHDRGFSQYRVRCHRDVARIEVPPGEMSRLLEPDIRDNVLQQLRDLGFAYVTIDLQGYRTGSLNETL